MTDDELNDELIPTEKVHSTIFDEIIKKLNVHVMTPEESAQYDEIRDELQEALINNPDAFRIRRSDVLMQDLVSATLLYGTKKYDLFKNEEWFDLGAVPVMDATREIISNEYNTMAKCLEEIFENPDNAQELLAKHFPDGLINRYDYENIDYSK